MLRWVFIESLFFYDYFYLELLIKKLSFHSKLKILVKVTQMGYILRYFKYKNKSCQWQTNKKIDQWINSGSKIIRISPVPPNQKQTKNVIIIFIN